MARVTFTYKVEFRGPIPGDQLLDLSKRVGEVQGVESVAASEMTVRCPVSELTVRAECFDSKEAVRIYNGIAEIIANDPNMEFWSRSVKYGDPLDSQPG